MEQQSKKDFWSKVGLWLPNIYYVTASISLIFIFIQVFYAKRSITESSDWEKAKLTIENIATFKESVSTSPLYKKDVLYIADGVWPDCSTEEGRKYADTLVAIYNSLFETKQERLDDTERLMSNLDAFAYPIIMGYASEASSFKSEAGIYVLLSNYIMPIAFKEYRLAAPYAKLLYRLWRAKLGVIIVERILREGVDSLILEQNKNSLLDVGDDLSVSGLEKYNNKLKKEVKEIKKEIEKFRKECLE